MSEKISLVHYWCYKIRGGEKVLRQIGLVFYNKVNKVYFNFGDKEVAEYVAGYCNHGRGTILDRLDRFLVRPQHKGAVITPDFEQVPVKFSILNKIPFVKKFYKAILPIHNWGLASLRIAPCDVVISSESGLAKNIKIPHRPGSMDRAVHICYVHSPMRYIWSHADQYRDKLVNTRADTIDQFEYQNQKEAYRYESGSGDHWLQRFRTGMRYYPVETIFLAICMGGIIIAEYLVLLFAIYGMYAFWVKYL